MNQKKVDSYFDCSVFKQQAQEKIAEETKNITPEKQIEYFHQKANSSSLGPWWKSVKNQ